MKKGKIIFSTLLLVALIYFKSSAQSPGVFFTQSECVPFYDGNFITGYGGFIVNKFDATGNYISRKTSIIPFNNLCTNQGGVGQRAVQVNENGIDYILWLGNTARLDTNLCPWPQGGWANQMGYIIKTDMAGNFIWCHAYYPIGIPTGVCFDKDSNYIVSCTHGPGTLLKVNKLNGDTIWTRQNFKIIGGVPGGVFNSTDIFRDSAGFKVGGMGYPSNIPCSMLMSTDSIGQVTSIKAYLDTTSGACWGMTKTHDNGFILVGQSAYDDPIVDTLWYHDFLVIRTDSNGDTLWCKRYDNNLQVEKAYSVVATDDGGFAILGTTHSWITNPQGNGADISMSSLLLKIDSLGNPVWAKTYFPNSPAQSFFTSQLKETAAKGFMWTASLVNVTDSMGNNCLAQSTTVTVGHPQITISSIQTNVKHEMDAQYSVNLVASSLLFGNEFDYCNYLPVSTIEKQEEIKIYPNPANEKLTVTTPSQKNKCTISLRNVFGKIIYHEELVLNSAEINTANIKAGIYFLTVKDVVGNSESKKVVVVH